MGSALCGNLGFSYSSHTPASLQEGAAGYAWAFFLFPALLHLIKNFLINNRFMVPISDLADIDFITEYPAYDGAAP